MELLLQQIFKLYLLCIGYRLSSVIVVIIVQSILKSRQLTLYIHN